MSVADLLKARISVRGFLPKPVPRALLEDIFSSALKSPSNCNVQPWNLYLVSGAARQQLSKELVAAASSGQAPQPDFEWVPKHEGLLRERQFGSADALYSAMGIERHDREARQQAALRNFAFFDAPHVLFFAMEKYLQLKGAVDLGIIAQTLTLLMAEQGIDSCMQGALNQYPAPVRALCNIPASQGIVFGMSFGYRDDSHPANDTRTSRESLDTLVHFFD
jgi:nitroreductase